MRQTEAYLRNSVGIAMVLSLTTLGIAQTTYTLRELPTLGGTVGAADSINDEGWIAGYANVAGNQTEHAVLWTNSTLSDLGTLGGPNSSVGFPTKNSQGILVGFSQTAASDPLREGWNYLCGPSGNKPLCQGKNLITRGFIWQDGVMRALPALGGNISEAFGINNSGQVVGVAETGNTDSTCVRPQVLDYTGVIWNPDGSMHALHPFAGDAISAAVGINNNGQAVGGSGPCAPLSPAIGTHAVLWQSGSAIATDLGNLGGDTNNVAFAINGESQIVGISAVSGNATVHAFFWQDGGPMQDLGTLPGDVLSIAYSLNDAGQIVGQSCDAKGNCRACIWQNGTATDLNALLAPGPTVHLLVALDINNRGQIVGQAYDQNMGNTIGFVVTPE
jgi:probable HAF family extracellular repeat protein